MADRKGIGVHLIDGIRVDPAKARRHPEFERDIREQLEASTRRFEKLKTTISNLVRFTRDIRGPVDVDLLERKAGRFNPNMDVVRCLRLTKYILSTMIHLTKGDPRLVDGMKPDESFFEKRPRLAQIVRTGTDVDTVLLSLYNESPRAFIADHDPQYAIPALLEEILIDKMEHRSLLGSSFHHAHVVQFEESMYLLTLTVLRLLFIVEETDTDMDVMLYIVRSRGTRPVRLKRVYADDVKRVHQRIDHSLFLLKEAATSVLQETERDASFIQRVLNRSFVVDVLSNARSVMKSLGRLDTLLGSLRGMETRGLPMYRRIRERTRLDVQELNRMMDSELYRELLLLARDMTESGSRFFTLLQSIFGFYADFAARNGIGLHELLCRLEKMLASQFATISEYLDCVPGLEKQLSTFRAGHATLTLIEEGRSEFFSTIIHEVSQVHLDFRISAERGKAFRRHLKSVEELELLYDPLYGDRIRNITAPVLTLRDSFPLQSKFSLDRYVAIGNPDPDQLRNAYRSIMKVGLLSEAILGFFGDRREAGGPAFDPGAVSGESAEARQHLKVVIGYCKDHISSNAPVGAEEKRDPRQAAIAPEESGGV